MSPYDITRCKVVRTVKYIMHMHAYHGPSGYFIRFSAKNLSNSFFQVRQRSTQKGREKKRNHNTPLETESKKEKKEIVWAKKKGILIDIIFPIFQTFFFATWFLNSKQPPSPNVWPFQKKLKKNVRNIP